MDERKAEIENFLRWFKSNLHNHISYGGARKLYEIFGSNYNAAGGFYWVVRNVYEQEGRKASNEELIDDLTENYDKWIRLARKAFRER